jgi:hypothetical protein
MRQPSTPESRQARASRLAATSKAKDRQRDIAQQQAQVRAAQAAVPHDRTTIAKAREQRSYLTGDYVHRLTGSRIRLLDTKAPDAPATGIAPWTGPGGESLRYAVQCLDHDSELLFYRTLKEAERAVRQSPSWCPDCAALLAARPKAVKRNKAIARG